MKLLVYVDTENVSLQKIIDKVTELKEEATDRGLGFCGKFYGNKDVIKSMIGTCYELGLEFVETSSLTDHKKNVADSKLIVDCLFDVLSVYKDGVAKVAILSNDNDFISLVYKLIAVGVEVDSMLLLPTSYSKSLDTISSDLKQAGFNPYHNGNMLQAQFPLIRSTLGEEYSDELIQQYLITRFSKLRTSLDVYFPEVDWSLLNCDGYNLDVELLLGFAQHKMELTVDLALKLANLYTRKIFGITLRSEALRAKLTQQSEIFRGLGR